MSKYEGLKRDVEVAESACVSLLWVEHTNEEYEQSAIAKMAASSKVIAYERAAAEMHDELVETLETMIFGDPDLDKVKDVIKRAKAI